MIDWRKDCKEAMWMLSSLQRTRDENRGTPDEELDRIDEETIRKNVCWLVRMETQKTAGQRKHSSHVSWNNYERVFMTICITVTTMALRGYFGEMPQMIEDPED